MKLYVSYGGYALQFDHGINTVASLGVIHIQHVVDTHAGLHRLHSDIKMAATFAVLQIGNDSPLSGMKWNALQIHSRI